MTNARLFFKALKKCWQECWRTLNAERIEAQVCLENTRKFKQYIDELNMVVERTWCGLGAINYICKKGSLTETIGKVQRSLEYCSYVDADENGALVQCIEPNDDGNDGKKLSKGDSIIGTVRETSRLVEYNISYMEDKMDMQEYDLVKREYNVLKERLKTINETEGIDFGEIICSIENGKCVCSSL